MSFGDFALSSAKSCFRRRSAWLAMIFVLDPVRKNCSTPLCRKLFITRIAYIIAIHLVAEIAQKAQVAASQQGWAEVKGEESGGVMEVQAVNAANKRANRPARDQSAPDELAVVSFNL